MLSRLLGCTILGFVLCSFGLEAGGTKDAKDVKKDAVTKDTVTKDTVTKDTVKDSAKKDSVKDSAKKDAVKDSAKKDAVKDSAKKDDAKKDKKTDDKTKGTTGKVKSTDLEKLSFTVTLDSGKDMTYTVADSTKFFGPRGGDRGTGKAGLKDDCMEKGYEVRVVADTKDSKLAAEVHLATRKGEKKAIEKKTDKK
jgi:hypothetical protein